MKVNPFPSSLTFLLVRGLLVLALTAPGLFAFGSLPAQAAAPSGMVYTASAAPTTAPSSASDPIRGLILKLAGDLLALMLFIGGVVFTISVAKGALDAQLNTLVGSPMGVSKAQMSLIASVVTGLLTLLSPMLVMAIFNALADSIASADISVPSPTVILH